MNKINELEPNKILNNVNNLDTIKNIAYFLNGEYPKIFPFIEKNCREDLFYYIYNKENIYNKKGTKLLNNEHYLTLITILNEYISRKEDFIFFLFNKINLNILKVIINGYIYFDNKENENELIYNIIKNILPLFFDKTIFYYIYNKLSKIFRKFYITQESNKEALYKKFIKLLNIWKLLYYVEDVSRIEKSFICLIGRNTLHLDMSKIKKKNKIKSINILIEFAPFFFLSYNDKIDNFCFVKLHYNFSEPKEIKCNDIKCDKDKKINKIQFKITKSFIKYSLNEDCEIYSDCKKIINTNIIDSKIEIDKVEILKDFIGGIKSVQIMLEHDINHTEYEVAVNDNSDKENKCYKIEKIKQNEKDENMNIFFEPSDEKFILCKEQKEIFYEDIRYYGGFQCFIPILKIINYFIKENNNNSEKINELNKRTIEIIKIIINQICFSKRNYLNFKSIFVPLLGALAEINHNLPEKYQKELYNHHIFSTLYMLITVFSFPFAQKKTYLMITGLKDINKLNINFEDLIINLNVLDYSNYQWYSIILYIYIGFILIVYNDYNKVPKNVVEQLIKIYKFSENKNNSNLEVNTLVKILIESLNYICNIKDEENNIFKKYEKINNLSNFLIGSLDSNIIYYIYNFLNIIKAFLNLIDFVSIIYEEKEQKENNINNIIDDNNNNSFKYKFKQLLESLESIFKNPNYINDNVKSNVTRELKEFIKHKELLKKIFDLKDNDFEEEYETILNEFTNYHSDYHKLMKNLFVFNKLWSDKKLFFTEKKKNIKYKYIDYYTTNYQKPLLFPVNDYKYSYPNLTSFEINEDFYLNKEENSDDYNFTLECPELDQFSIKYEREIIKTIEDKYIYEIKIYNVCLVKRTHHVKGKLFCLNLNGLIKKLLFYSFPYDIEKDIPFCNVIEGIENLNHNKEKLCFGSVFTCPKKDMNKKITILVSNIRLILKRIYYYRQTAIEIFTNTKSYYFNFAEDFKDKNTKLGKDNCEYFLYMMAFNEFFPINIKGSLIGFSRDFNTFKKKYDEEKNKMNNPLDDENKFVSLLFEHWKPNDNGLELSTFDMIIYLNLLSNRSYIDIFQYPVFPLLFFYDKNEDKTTFIYLERDLEKHIGFQTISEKSKNRKNLVQRGYDESIKESEENEDEKEETEKPFYFKTHYSNNVYTSNYLIRLFPFSFLAIELQGDGFDTPNRLFFSIENTFNNISNHKSDIRELIPEFFYFPEMFMNINKINFHERTNGELVNDVEMPSDLNISNNTIDKDKESENLNYFRSFRFVEKMRNLLESKTNDINNWINIIFGTKQRYNNSKKNDQLFGDETYIDFSVESENVYNKYVNDKNSMTSVEFGITPVQILFNEKEIYNNRYSIYDKNVKDNKELYQNVCKQFIETMKIEKENNKIINKDKKKTDNTESNKSSRVSCLSRFSRLVESINNQNNNNKNDKRSKKNIISYNYKNEKIEFKGYQTGKVDVIIHGKLYDKLYDHNDEIICIHYNKRLNMYSTTSKDGFLCVYMFPNKLITAIKNSNGSYFNLVFLSSNPFPSIIAFDEKEYEIYSFSINGFMIKKCNILKLLEKQEKKDDLKIFSHFNENGGTYKDRLFFLEENIKGKTFKFQLFTVPFFDKEEKIIEIKKK